MNPRRIATVFAFLSACVFVCGCSTQDSAVPTNVSTVAGSNGEFGEPFGMAIHDGETFISDGEHGKIFRMAPDNGVTEVASQMHTPSGIAFDNSGNLIVADSGSNSIKRVDRNGTVEIIAGVEGQRGFADGNATQALFNGPVGIAVLEDGTVFIADTYNDRIRVFKDGVV